MIIVSRDWERIDKPSQSTMGSTEMTAIAPPEQYVLPATKYCPNNEMPVLIYRNVLPSPRTEKSVQEWIEKNGWLRAVSVDWLKVCVADRF